MIITIDGPAGSGKGTLAKALTSKYNLLHLETGLLYRTVAYYLLNNNKAIDSVDAAYYAQQLDLQKLPLSTSLRAEKIGQVASIIATFPEVRSTLLAIQKNFVAQIPVQYQGLILDGRDAGTAICPQADVKIFLTADYQTRAQRRYHELQMQGNICIYEDILKSVIERDERDMKREVAPLVPAHDAMVVDSSNLTPIELVNKVADLVNRYLDCRISK